MLSYLCMNIYNKSAINEFGKRHAVCKEPLLSWYDHVRSLQWRIPADIKKNYPKASIIGRGTDLVVFDILGGNYRLITSVNYNRRWIFIKWFGTHAEYDKLDVTKL